MKPEDLICPYINKRKAELWDTKYFCDFDGMEFDSMRAHCAHCEMYENLIRTAIAKCVSLRK